MLKFIWDKMLLFIVLSDLSLKPKDEHKNLKIQEIQNIFNIFFICKLYNYTIPEQNEKYSFDQHGQIRGIYDRKIKTL